MEPNQDLKQPGTILVVEDDEDISMALQEALRFEGYSVISASNGSEALQLIRSQGSPDLIFLDMMMPVMNGWQFLEVRSSDPILSRIPVIVVSAAGDKARVNNISGFLKKPADLDIVLQRANQFCRSSHSTVSLG